MDTPWGCKGVPVTSTASRDFRDIPRVFQGASLCFRVPQGYFEWPQAVSGTFNRASGSLRGFQGRSRGVLRGFMGVS